MASASGHGVFLKNLSVSFVQLKNRHTWYEKPLLPQYDSAGVRDDNTQTLDLVKAEQHHQSLLVSPMLKHRMRIAN